MVGGLPGGDTRSEIPWVQGKKGTGWGVGGYGKANATGGCHYHVNIDFGIPPLSTELRDLFEWLKDGGFTETLIL